MPTCCFKALWKLVTNQVYQHIIERFRSFTDTDTNTGICSRVAFRACGFKRGFAHTKDKGCVATVTDDILNMAEQEELLYLAIQRNDENLQRLLLMPQEGKTTYDPDLPRFNLEDQSDQQALNRFRFDKENIYRLARSLALPDEIQLTNCCICSGTDALCILLRRLVYPNRLSDLETLFGRPKSTLSLIINHTLDFIYDRHGYLLSSLDQPWFQQEALEAYAAAIHAKGAPLTNCFGFIDGTV